MLSRNFNAVLLLLVTARLSLTQQETMTVCPVNVQNFILRNRTILPLQNIIATSEDSTNNPATGFIETSSGPWCTAENEGAAEVGNYVELIFTELIVVEFLESKGQINTWVSNFSIQYSQTESGDDFVTYGVLETSQSFIVEDILTSSGYFSLERPIMARRLRLVINRGTTDQFGRLCWHIELFGCPLSRARQIQYSPPSGTNTPIPSSTTGSSSMPPSQSLPPIPPVTDCPSTSGSFSLTAKERQQEILIIVLPAALATIVVVLIIAFISILICVCATRRSPSKDSNASCVSMMLHPDTSANTSHSHLSPPRYIMHHHRRPSRNQSPNDPCFHYDSPRPVAYDVPRASVRSRGGSFASSNDTLHTAISNEVKNPMYITKQGLPGTTCNSHQFTSLINQVESSATNDYEMISDSVTMDNRLYELQRTNSQPSRPKPELPAARTAGQPSSSYYASIPADNGVPPTTAVTAVENNPVSAQSNVPTNESDSIKAHGYAKVHKPSITQGRVGGVDPASPTSTTTSVTPADNINQTTL